MQVGLVVRPGEHEETVIHAGDAGFAPKSIQHYIRNVGQGTARIVLIFNAGVFTNIDVGFMLGNVPPQVCMSRALHLHNLVQ